MKELFAIVCALMVLIIIPYQFGLWLFWISWFPATLLFFIIVGVGDD